MAEIWKMGRKFCSPKKEKKWTTDEREKGIGRIVEIGDVVHLHLLDLVLHNWYMQAFSWGHRGAAVPLWQGRARPPPTGAWHTPG